MFRFISWPLNHNVSEILQLYDYIVATKHSHKQRRGMQNPEIPSPCGLCVHHFTETGGSHIIRLIASSTIEPGPL